MTVCGNKSNGIVWKASCYALHVKAASGDTDNADTITDSAMHDTVTLKLLKQMSYLARSDAALQ